MTGVHMALIKVYHASLYLQGALIQTSLEFHVGLLQLNFAIHVSRNQADVRTGSKILEYSSLSTSVFMKFLPVCKNLNVLPYHCYDGYRLDTRKKMLSFKILCCVLQTVSGSFIMAL